MPKYKPRHATKRWQEGAPEYVLDVFDNKGKTADRYTVLIGGSLWDETMLRNVHYLGMSDAPTHPQGVSMWGECPASYRPSHQRIKWLDLPENIRKHVIARCTDED